MTNTESNSANENVQPKRLAITVSGAVSLGSYEAGVLWEVLDAIRQHNSDARTVGNPEDRIIVDVLTGASAGGMSAIILAQKLLYNGDKFKSPYDNPLYDIWVKGIDLAELQNTEADKPALNSLLSSNLIERIADSALLARYAQTGAPPKGIPHPAIDCDRLLGLGVALSNLNGVDYGYRVEPQGIFEYREYADQLTRLINPKGSAHDSKAFWAPLHRAAVATGAFPVAFRPQELRRSAKGEPDDFPPERLMPWAYDPRSFTYTDGGVFQNQPLGMAKNLVDLQDDHLSQDCRYYLFVSPHAKDDGPPSNFCAAEANYLRLIIHLATATMGQAAFRDWITAEGVNDHVRLMDERATGLKNALLSKQVAVGPLQTTASALLDFLFPQKVSLLAPGAHKSESRTQAEQRIADQYRAEITTLSSIPNADIAFRDSMLAFETAAGLGARDQMKIYGVTAKPSELAGFSLESFLGFFDEAYRDHDYNVGRKHAQEFLSSGFLSNPGEIGPIHFTPSPLDPIDEDLNGRTFGEVPERIRKRFKKSLQERVGEMIAEWRPRSILRGPLTWLAKYLVSDIVDWLARSGN